MDETRLAKRLQDLSPAERKAYEQYMEQGKPPLAPSTQGQMFELYLNGSSCEEIARLNPNFSFGMIVRAKVEGYWDEKKACHIADLLNGVRERVQQVQLEAVVFAADMISATHKMNSDRIKKFIQTGDEEYVKDLSLDKFATYLKSINLLLQLTGQDKKSQVVGEIVHKHEGGVPATPHVGLTAKQAERILEIIDKEDEGN